MKTLNRVQLIALLGADPKIYAMPNGTLVARFSIATQYVYKDKKIPNVIRKSTEWHSLIVMGDLATMAERFLQKGTCIHIEGRLKSREYEDKDKTMQRTTEIIVSDLIVLHGGKRELIPLIQSDQKVTSHQLEEK